MLDGLKKQLKSLGDITLEISAKGTYKDKHRTKVQDVAVYQNDGTKHIKASHFVERAARSKRDWRRGVGVAVNKWLSGNEREMTALGRVIAADINNRVDRIDTRRLKHSFVHRIRRK